MSKKVQACVAYIRIAILWIHQNVLSSIHQIDQTYFEFKIGYLVIDMMSLLTEVNNYKSNPRHTATFLQEMQSCVRGVRKFTFTIFSLLDMRLARNYSSFHPNFLSKFVSRFEFLMQHLTCSLQNCSVFPSISTKNHPFNLYHCMCKHSSNWPTKIKQQKRIQNSR